ncbi:MAG: hypothetical protein AAFY02_05605 [Pseudomonadota bacterium]
MQLEVPSLRPHSLQLGRRILLIHHDMENGFAGEEGAFRPGRTGRITDAGPFSAFNNNERVNIALFFGHGGAPGSFLPGPAVSNNRLDAELSGEILPNQYSPIEDQRGASYVGAVIHDGKLYLTHQASRSMVADIVHSLPEDDKYYIFSRTAVDIREVIGQDAPFSCRRNKDNTTPTGTPTTGCYQRSYAAYKPTRFNEGSTDENNPDYLSIPQQASMSLETDTVNYFGLAGNPTDDQMLQVQFKFRAHLPGDGSNNLPSDYRMGIITVGGPDDYGVLEIGHPDFPNRIVFRRSVGDQSSILTSAPYTKNKWTDVNLFLHGRGVSVKIDDRGFRNFPRRGDNDDGFDPQKVFFGYGYTQGVAYNEANFNPNGFVEIQTATVRSRTVLYQDLDKLDIDPNYTPSP